MSEPRLTFAQRHGLESIPVSLKPKQMSQQLRALLWAPICKDFDKCVQVGFDHVSLAGRWYDIMLDLHVKVAHQMAHTFQPSPTKQKTLIAGWFENGNYSTVLGFVEWLLRHPQCPVALRDEIAVAFQDARAAYRIAGGDTVIELSSEADAATVERALESAASSGLKGTRVHLQAAIKNVRDKKWADGVRESIHAVDAVLSVLEPEAGRFDRALARLEAKGHVHGSLKAGFASLYGFASDERGVRHSLRDAPDAEVDEFDALYMLGTCSAFVTYLIGKATAAGLLGD